MTKSLNGFDIAIIDIDREIFAHAHALLSAHLGGQAVVRDPKILEAALDTPRALFERSQQVSIYQLAAVLAGTIVRTKPFADGNQRMAFVAMKMLLDINGYQLDISERQAAKLIRKLADGEAEDKALEKVLSANCYAGAPLRLSQYRDGE